jgi:UDP:flavonoid glycosyltransferase YjiC (YdhE family)
VRALFTSLPATGHFNSIMPLALAMRDAGHELAVCCAPQFADRLAAIGIRHFPGGGHSLDEFLPRDLKVFAPERARFMQREVFAAAAPDRLMPDLAQAVEDWRPEVLLRESSEFAACVLAEKLGLPHAAVATGSSASLDAGRRFFAEALTKLRQRHGLSPDPKAGMMHRYLTFSLMPATWDGDAVVPATLHYIRYESPPTAGGELPEWLRSSGERPLVLAALGTLMYREPGLLAAIIEALGQLPVDAVVAIGPDQDPAQFGIVPANVRLEPFIAQIDALVGATVFVTHGGFNSIKEALSQGVPLVVIPIGAEQPYTAGRVEALGLGRAVAVDERTPQVIRDRTAEVLGDPRFRRNAAALAAEIALLPPLGQAVALVERLAEDHQPILRLD